MDGQSEAITGDEFWEYRDEGRALWGYRGWSGFVPGLLRTQLPEIQVNEVEYLELRRGHMPERLRERAL
jgi:hypothetical protein